MLSLVLAFCSCGGDHADSGKLVEEIQTEGKISSIIRSPISADGSIDTINVAKMTFATQVFEFDEVPEGTIVQHVFKFKNDGKIPLIIQNAHSTCGCTVPEWPKEPIEPNESGEIKVEFDTKSKTGLQEKLVIITANTYPSVTRLFLKGFVIKDGE